MSEDNLIEFLHTKPLLQAVIWGFANSLYYAISAFSSYPNSIPSGAPERWIYGIIAFILVLVASTITAWYVIRPRLSRPTRAWRLGGIASSIAATFVFVPILYWITANSYIWYMRIHPGAVNYTMMTFFGGLISLPISFVMVFLSVNVISEGLFWLNRHQHK